MSNVIELDEERGVGYVAKHLRKYIKDHNPDKVIAICYHADTEEEGESVTMLFANCTTLDQLGILEIAKSVVLE